MMDNNIPKYHQYLSRHIKVMDRARIAHVQDNKTDKQTDRRDRIYHVNFGRGV